MSGLGHNSHLTADEIGELLDNRDNASRQELERAEHVRSCRSCQERMELYREQDARLRALVLEPPAGTDDSCPTAEEWAAVATGGIEGKRAEDLLAHAGACGPCGQLLKQAIEACSDELTPKEERAVAALASAGRGWQRQMAEKILPEPVPVWKRLQLLLRTALAAVAAAVVIAVVWYVIPSGRTSAELLLASAYTEQRPFEFRIPSAAHGPVRQQRGGLGSSFSKPPSLLDAEARIARELKKSPDSAEWLSLRARAEMLAWDPEAAIATLTRALDARPDDAVLMAELGAAYAMRAEAQDRAIDYGQAIEYLTRAIRAKSDFNEAIFNRALVYERMFLYDEALKEWRQYLTLDAQGGWADEARRRLAEIEEKKRARQAALARISPDPAHFLRRIATAEAVEPEQYIEFAITQWLPRRWDDAATEGALHTLAAAFVTRHRDPWLRDVLVSRRSEQLLQGLRALSGAVQANRADEHERALAFTHQASTRLRAAGNSAGALLAQADRSYALHRTFQPVACRQEALHVEREAAARKYAWVLGYMILQAGICRGYLGDFGQAQDDMARAVEAAREAGYKSLELRAAGVLAGTQTAAGNLLASWNQGRDGLATFWANAYSGIRAHQFHFNIASAAEALGWYHAAYVSVKAAVGNIADGPHRRFEALGRARAAKLAQLAGLSDDAAAEYKRAAALFAELTPTKAVREQRAYAELYSVEAEAANGAVNAALARLAALREQASVMDSELVQVKLQQAVGDVHWRAAQLQEADSGYRAAAVLSERRLDSLRAFDARAEAVIAAGKAYRGLVELRWSRDGDITGALQLWEWFRSGEWRDRGDEAAFKRTFDQRLRQLRRETFLSYANLPGGMVAWVFDDRGVTGQRLTVPADQLEKTTARFLRLCADAGSDRQILMRDARQLYDWLVAPVAGRLDASRTLVIEPDGVVSSIPAQALLDGQSRYLGERFPIVISGGLVDYQKRAAAAAIHVDARAVVVAAPALGGETSRAFPPLVQAVREGASVASRFPRSVTLAQKEATLVALERHRREAELLHFAGHGFSNAGNGGLLLAPGNTNSAGAGILDGKRLAEQGWSQCRLAVLSACSTGTGESRGPVNPESLVRRLLWAGVARVVATRWNVEAETSASLMDGFYSALLAGNDVATALQRAARHIRERRASEHPYYWAGVQSFGSR